MVATPLATPLNQLAKERAEGLVMASPVAITIESEDRAGFGSSVNSQRSYGTVKVSSASFTSSGRLGGYVIHTVHEEDTLQGLALRYNVSVSGLRGRVSS